MHCTQLFLVLILLGAMFLPAAAAERPNVILLFCDDLGYGDLGCYGSTTHRTPNLDRMAAEGMRFTDFYAAANVCTPSRAALMTGCYAKRVSLQHRVLFPYSQSGLHPEEITLAELLRAQGYATGCFGKWHLGHLAPFLPTVQGFDEFWGVPYSNDMGNHFYRRSSDGKQIDFLSPPLPVFHQAEPVEHDPDQRFLTASTTAKSLGFIERNREKPFFCYVPLSMPHTPLGASPRFRGKSAGGFYGDVIEEIDWAAGEFMATVERLGLTERTMILFTSDNGGVVRPGDEAYGTSSCGPLRGRKGTTWEGGHRVPLIVRWPGTVPAGAECTDMTLMMDILPTVARFAGTSEPHDRVIDGKDVRALWLGKPNATCPHEAYFYYSNEEIHAVRSGNWKLHVKRPDWKQQGFEASDVYLFNLRGDIGESENVAAAHPEEVDRLTALVERARKDLGDTGVPEAAGERVRPAGLAESPPRSFLPEAIAGMEPGSRHRDILEQALRAAPPLAYKMRDWQWAEVDGQPLTLDAWWPGGAGPWPMVVWVHGADPDGGCKELGNYTARRIASHGYVVLSINYRAAPAHPFPAAVEDCLGAVVWAKREAARFNGNPARVAIAGESAGGSLAALAAYAADRDRFHPTGARPGDPDPFVRAVVSVGGLFDFAAVAEDGVRNAEPPTHTLAESRVDGSARGAAASPRTWLDPHDPPTLLICGSADPFFKQSIALKKALVHNRVDHEFFSPEQTGCGFLVWEWDSNASRDAVRRMVAFLDRVLK